MKRLEKLKGRKGKAHSHRAGYTSAQARDNGEARARRIVVSGLALAALHQSDLAGLKKSDWRKRVIGRLVRRSTTLSAGWIAEALKMGDPKRAATLVHTDPDPSWGTGWKHTRQFMRDLEEKIEKVD